MIVFTDNQRSANRGTSMIAKCRDRLISISCGNILAVFPSALKMIVIILAIINTLLSCCYSLASAGILHVDRANPLCSDLGPGTEQTPYCTINSAALVATAGDTVVVSAGNYLEQVNTVNSGSAFAPILFTVADGAIVNVFGEQNGFRISSRGWITINGFTVSDTTSYGIYVKYSSHITISNNHVTRSGQPIIDLNHQGIYMNSTTDSLISGNTVDYNSDSGIYVSNGSTRITIINNHTSYNAQVFSRAAPGIDVRSPGNIIKANISHDNEDSGIQIRSGANENLVVNNLCYNNGDHGIDVLRAPAQRIIGNTVYGSVASGINIEGGSTDCTLANNITVDNGIQSPRKDGNINVEEQSIPGTVIDYGLMFLNEPWIMIVWAGNDYMSLADFVAATGMETHGIEADPNWVSPGTGDFHLMAGSPAIDSANSAVNGAEASDIELNPRLDDPSTPDTGAGPRTYDDRGAYEYQATSIPDT